MINYIYRYAITDHTINNQSILQGRVSWPWSVTYSSKDTKCWWENVLNHNAFNPSLVFHYIYIIIFLTFSVFIFFFPSLSTIFFRSFALTTIFKYYFYIVFRPLVLSGFWWCEIKQEEIITATTIHIFLLNRGQHRVNIIRMQILSKNVCALKYIFCLHVWKCHNY